VHARRAGKPEVGAGPDLAGGQGKPARPLRTPAGAFDVALAPQPARRALYSRSMDVGNSVWSAAALLFFVMDPSGNAPIVLSLLKGVEKSRRRPVVFRELVIALGVLLFFLFLGVPILSFLGLQEQSIAIGGGIVLGVIGLRMVFPSAEGVMGAQLGGEPFIVPLAIPLIAGPSAMAVVILLARTQPDAMGRWVGALLLAWAGTAAVLLAAPLLYRALKERGLIAIERLMGMLLIMLAVQMVVNGVTSL
jgi:multiple antibiotic resistance protein